MSTSIVAAFIAPTQYSFGQSFLTLSVDVDPWRARSYPAAKISREAYFPLKLLEKAYKIRVEQGEASVEEDRDRILNSIARKPLKSKPASQHPAYDAVTCRIFKQRG